MFIAARLTDGNEKEHESIEMDGWMDGWITTRKNPIASLRVRGSTAK